MPDAREMLKKLAKESRHKGVGIKVPDDITRPAPLKKIKRPGPTRPYQMVEPEGSDNPVNGDRDAAERSGAMAAQEGGQLGSPELGIREPSVPDDVRALTDASALPVDSAPVQGARSGLKDAEIRGTTDNQKAGNKGTDVKAANAGPSNDATQVALLVSTVASEVGSPPSFPTREMVGQSRGGGQTVTNLAKRSLIQPDWQADLTKEEGFLRAHFRTAFGKGKMAKEVDLYCQLYAEARSRQSVSLHFLSAELGELVGSSSNGTIRARLLSCEKLGLFIQQGFNNETKEHRRGTYIHLHFPWL